MAFGAILGQSQVIPPVLYPQIIVTTNPNIQVTANYNGIVVSAMSDTSGIAVLNVPRYGEWVVSAGTKTQQVTIDTVKQYPITLYIYDLLSEKSLGSIVKIKENNVDTNFIVAVHNYYSNYNSNLTLLIRQNLFKTDVVYYGGGNYINSSVQQEIVTYSSALSQTMKNMIGNTIIEYFNGDDTSKPATSSFKFFTPSATEWGAYKSSNYMLLEGTPFNNTILNLYRNVFNTVTWTRSMYTRPFDYGEWAMTGYREAVARVKNTSAAILPCFTLPGNTFVDDNNNIVEQ